MAKSFREAFKNVGKVIEKITSKKCMSDLGKEIIAMVEKRTKLGYGSKDGTKKKLTPLSPPYKKYRKNLKNPKESKAKNKPNLSGNTSPSKSNLTLTGKMLEDMKEDSSIGKVIVDFKSDFSREKAEWNTEKGRAFMELTKQEEKRVAKKVQEIADNIIRKSN